MKLNFQAEVLASTHTKHNLRGFVHFIITLYTEMFARSHKLCDLASVAYCIHFKRFFLLLLFFKEVTYSGQEMPGGFQY